MKKIYITAGASSTFMGPGRKEFNPKKVMPGFEHYLKESIDQTLLQVPQAEFDEGYISNFMASRFIQQGNLAGFLPHFVPSLLHKPCFRLEGACGSGGLALTSAARSILSGLADTALVCGFEIQNTIKALYGADILAGAAYHKQERKHGHAYFFPELFSQRAGAYYDKTTYTRARQGLAQWYANAIDNARINPKAQEFHNTDTEPFLKASKKPDSQTFLEHLNLYDCSKISDGAASLVMASEEGLKKLGIATKDAIELVAFNSSEGDITQQPKDLSQLTNTAHCTHKTLQAAKITQEDIGLLELHDCFSITGVLALEAAGFCKDGTAADFVYEGNTQKDGQLPTNLSGGLCGFGHPTGATGIRQMVDLFKQLTQQADNQVKLKKEFGMMVSMGGNDITVSTLIVAH
jgi:acetyl-CoA C-acetyltransferase